MSETAPPNDSNDPPGAVWSGSIEPPFGVPVCRSLTGAMPTDVPCPDCGHRIGSHAIRKDGGTCDVCAVIRVVTA